jgi:Ca2+-transporting ATPase
MVGIVDVQILKELEPLLPIHILWINLVTDSLPALALAVDPAVKGIMSRKPVKTRQGIFTRGMTKRVVYQGAMIGFLTLAAFIIGLNTEGKTDIEKLQIGQTMAFLVLALSQLVHVFNVRDNKQSIFKTGILSNKMLLLATAFSAMLMFVLLFVPFLQTVFNLAPLPASHVFEVVILVLAPIAIVEIAKLFKINTAKDEI